MVQSRWRTTRIALPSESIIDCNERDGYATLLRAPVAVADRHEHIVFDRQTGKVLLEKADLLPDSHY